MIGRDARGGGEVGGSLASLKCNLGVDRCFDTVPLLSLEAATVDENWLLVVIRSEEDCDEPIVLAGEAMVFSLATGRDILLVGGRTTWRCWAEDRT